MKILVIGEATNLLECREKFGEVHHYSVTNDHTGAQLMAEAHDLIFDFNIEENRSALDMYKAFSGNVFFNTVKVTLAELFRDLDLSGCKIFGFNGLPTFLNRPLLEISLYKNSDREHLALLCNELNAPYVIVDDRVGLVTPRVVCMIINEAYYTVQERTAMREDIDLAMKLGTNYPYGPFEWSKRIGIRHVYELLRALYDDTGDERYKICPLLKQEYLRAESSL